MATLGEWLARQGESPPTWFLACAVLVWVQSQWLPFWPTGRVLDVLGGVLIAGGLALLFVSLREFARHKTTMLPREVPQRLLTTGTYGVSRNPIYVADVGMLLGLVLILDLGGLPVVALFALAMDRRFIRGEEEVCAATFGPEWTAYAARVRRWL